MEDLGKRAEDLEEEEVWAVMSSTKEGSFNNPKSRKSKFSSGSSSAWRFSGAPRAVPKPTHQPSAPVDIPDWSKIMKKKPKRNLWDDACDVDDVDDATNHVKVDDDVVSDDDNDMVPPHEYLARRLATTRIASYSMCEGIGGTLKGRDLSKLRNAILTKTGFLE
ncbi:hypothetical protein ACJIZ3_012753 [Penstemon smallii]|uniref:Senescence regulator n=1 Tax=Penstemon smallii TaxID=265156 RepID=A0ABD3UPI1_9LAMI